MKKIIISLLAATAILAASVVPASAVEIGQGALAKNGKNLVVKLVTMKPGAK